MSTSQIPAKTDMRADAAARIAAHCFPWQQDLIRLEDDYAGCAVLSVPQPYAGRALVYVGPSGAWTHDVKRAAVIGAM